MGELAWWHWLIVVLVFVLLFGSKRLPDAARSLGRSMRIFKSELKTMHDEDAATPPSPTVVPPATASGELPAPPVTPPADPTSQTPSVGEHTDAR